MCRIVQILFLLHLYAVVIYAKGDLMTREYLFPKRIIELGMESNGVVDTHFLLGGYAGQLTTDNNRCCVLNSNNGNGTALLLDFGKEIHGSIEIAAAIRNSKKPVRVRIRYGESVSEAMSSVCEEATMDNATNDHAMRDFIINVPWLGTVETSNSGFRFVRIDLVDENVVLPIKAVQAVAKYRDIPYIGSFQCNDQRLNDIWRTGAYTVHLNMQTFLWDGIKRDRLVWLGDMHPEVMVINSVFGNNEVIGKSLDFGRETTPLPRWMNDMCSYSLWWIITLRDQYLYNGDYAYLEKQREYLMALLKQVIDSSNDNKENFRHGTRFIDWPTSDDEQIIHAGLQALMIMALDAGMQLCDWLGEQTWQKECETHVAKLRTYHPEHNDNKQAAALHVLAGLDDAQYISDAIIGKGGAKGFSTFLGYYMLCAMAQGGQYQKAMNIISDYWGLMLDLGATTFWEDLDYSAALGAARIDELVPQDKHDIHAKGGAYCYKGLRHSLCHGWAAGPTAWLSQNVLGVTPVEPVFRKVRIAPHLGDLKWVKGTFPTPHGVIEVSHRKTDNGKIISRIKLPKGVKIAK